MSGKGREEGEMNGAGKTAPPLFFRKFLNPPLDPPLAIIRSACGACSLLLEFSAKTFKCFVFGSQQRRVHVDDVNYDAANFRLFCKEHLPS